MWKLKSKFSLFFAKKLQYKSNCQKLGEKNLDLGMKQEGHSSFSEAGTHFFNVMLSLFEYSHFSNNRFLLSHYCKTKYKPYWLCYLHTPVPQSPYPSNCLAVKTCAEGGFTCHRHPPSPSLALDSTNSHSFCSRYSIFRSFLRV